MEKLTVEEKQKQINEYKRHWQKNNKCPHGKQKKQCVDCGGSSICTHGKRKAVCVDCGGSGICIHIKHKSVCVDCAGSSICTHGKRKSVCVDCAGSSICIHGKRKQRCKDCSIYSYLVNIQRGRINRLMKLTNLEKTKPSIEYLDCSAEFFKDYILQKMTPDMTFDNIHFDHIKPVSKFNLDDPEEFMKCCHYTNFQPLLAVDNLSKSDKWGEEDELFWNDNIIYKDYLLLYFPTGK